MCREGFAVSLAVSFPGTQAQWPPARPPTQHPSCKGSPHPTLPATPSAQAAQNRSIRNWVLEEG